MTQKSLISEQVGSVWKLLLPVVPVPASRPRFSRWGSGIYYGKRYTAFRKICGEILGSSEIPSEFPLEGPLAVSAVFMVPRPKTTKRTFPRGDVDNYFKTLAVLNEVVWLDDDQLVWASMSIEFGDCPGIRLEVSKVERIPTTRTLPQLWV